MRISLLLFTIVFGQELFVQTVIRASVLGVVTVKLKLGGAVLAFPGLVIFVSFTSLLFQDSTRIVLVA